MCHASPKECKYIRCSAISAALLGSNTYTKYLPDKDLLEKLKMQEGKPEDPGQPVAASMDWKLSAHMAPGLRTEPGQSGAWCQWITPMLTTSPSFWTEKIFLFCEKEPASLKLSKGPWPNSEIWAHQNWSWLAQGLKTMWLYCIHKNIF